MRYGTVEGETGESGRDKKRGGKGRANRVTPKEEKKNEGEGIGRGGRIIMMKKAKEEEERNTKFM